MTVTIRMPLTTILISQFYAILVADNWCVEQNVFVQWRKLEQTTSKYQNAHTQKTTTETSQETD